MHCTLIEWFFPFGIENHLRTGTWPWFSIKIRTCDFNRAAVTFPAAMAMPKYLWMRRTLEQRVTLVGFAAGMLRDLE